MNSTGWVLNNLPGLEFSTLMDRLLSGINIHLKGVALRIRAKESLNKGGDEDWSKVIY